MIRRLSQFISVVFLLLTEIGGYANAAEPAPNYPNRPIQLVVPYAPGGVTDALARLIAQKMSIKLGQPVVVENKPGAGTIIGTSFVSRRPADGYTLLLTTAAFLINPTFREDMPYDTLKEFSLVTSIAKGPAVLVVNPSVPAKTLSELVDYARKNPGKLNYGSSGLGGFPQLAVELLRSMAKIDLLHIPYNGSAPAAMALISGQTSMGIDGVMLYMPQIETGKIRPLAVTSKTRVPLLPNVPTIAESGYPNYDLQAWLGVLVGSGTPKEIIKELNKTIVEIVGTEEVKAFLKDQALDASTETPEEARRNLTSYVAKWADVVTTSSESAK